MKTIFIFLFLISSNFDYSQSFYETIMQLNVSLSDTSNDCNYLERSANVFSRLIKDGHLEWQVWFHRSLCLVRMADLFLKSDTLMSRNKLAEAKNSIKILDSLNKNSEENKILNLYIKIIDSRLNKINSKKLKLIETEMIEIKNNNMKNPRIFVLHAYFNLKFYSKDKIRKAKSGEYLKQAEQLYDLQKPANYEPFWGKKWCSELQKETKNNP